MDLISCVCLTIPGREKFLERAIDCFTRQTYSNRELVIVAEPDYSLNALATAVGSLSWPTVALVIPAAKLSVGAKRNEGCKFARGSHIAIWDDDDYSAPHRLSQQHGLLNLAGKEVTTLEQIYFTDADCTRWWLSDRGWIDTSLFFTRRWWEKHQFTDKMLGQDADFIRAATAADQFHLGGDPRWMFATNHAGNTCDRSCLYGPENALKNFTWKD